MNQSAIVEAFRKDKHLRVLFFFDEDGSNEEEVRSLALEGIQVEFPSVHSIQDKVRVLELSQQQRLLLYFPHARPSGDSWDLFLLRGLYHANREIAFDEVAEFMEEFNLVESCRPIVKRYISILKYDKYKRLFASILNPDSFQDRQVRQGLIGNSLGADTFISKEESFIRILISCGSEEKSKEILPKLNKWDLEKDLRNWIERYFDWGVDSLSLDTFRELQARFKYYVLTHLVKKPVDQDHYKRLWVQDKQARNLMYGLFRAWQVHPKYSPELEGFLELVPDIEEQNLVLWYGLESTTGYETRKVLISKLREVLSWIHDNPFEAEVLLSNWRNQQFSESDLRRVIDFAWHGAKMMVLLNGYPSYHFPSIQAFWRKYADELYEVDYHYRRAFQEMDLAKPFELEGLSEYSRKLHGLYQRFLVELNNGWLQLLNEKQFRIREHIHGDQISFFQKYIRPLDVKGVVIISDALRYEIARELETRLISDARNEVEIEPLVAPLPSVTKLGMAQLLPHKIIQVEVESGTLTVTVDGVSSEGILARRAILQNANSESDAISFSTVRGWGREEGRDYFKQHDLVFIYHDRIDAIGDQRKTENLAFDTIDSALSELEWLINMLTKSWNRRKVFVTSDHGFLYDRKEIGEDMMEDLPVSGKESLVSQRYLISNSGKEGKVNGYRFPLRNIWKSVPENLDMILPRSINRFRRQGAGKRFVHGGASLQELMVPILIVSRKREEKGQKVGVRLIPEKKILTTSFLKVTVLQEQPVDNQVRSREILIGLYSDFGQLLCEEKPLTLDSPAHSPKDRITEIFLQLDGGAVGSTFCHLRAYDVEDNSKLNPLIQERIIINLLMDKDDF